MLSSWRAISELHLDTFSMTLGNRYLASCIALACLIAPLRVRRRLESTVEASNWNESLHEKSDLVYGCLQIMSIRDRIFRDDGQTCADHIWVRTTGAVPDAVCWDLSDRKEDKYSVISFEEDLSQNGEEFAQAAMEAAASRPSHTRSRIDHRADATRIKATSLLGWEERVRSFGLPS